MENKRTWKMPKWMEPYRPLIINTGGNPIEDLMNDRGTNSQNNIVRWAMIVSIQSQITMLGLLWKNDLLPREIHGIAEIKP